MHGRLDICTYTPRVELRFIGLPNSRRVGVRTGVRSRSADRGELSEGLMGVAISPDLHRRMHRCLACSESEVDHMHAFELPPNSALASLHALWRQASLCICAKS